MSTISSEATLRYDLANRQVEFFLTPLSSRFTFGKNCTYGLKEGNIVSDTDSIVGGNGEREGLREFFFFRQSSRRHEDALGALDDLAVLQFAACLLELEGETGKGIEPDDCHIRFTLLAEEVEELALQVDLQAVE